MFSLRHKNVAWYWIVMFFYVDKYIFNIYLLIHFPDVSQIMEALGGFCFEPSRMFFTSLCKMRGLPPHSHLQTVARKVKMRTRGLQIDNWTSGHATNTKGAHGSGSVRRLQCKKVRVVWECLLCLYEQEKVARKKPRRIFVLPQTEEQASRGRAASHIWETLPSAAGTGPGALMEMTFCVHVSTVSSINICNSFFFRCLNEFWVKVEKVLKAERRRASLSVAGLPDHTQVHAVWLL